MPVAPPHGTPVGLEIPVKNTARAAAFYTAVFGWQSAPSTLGIPSEKILTFTVSGGVLPIGGAFRRVEETAMAADKSTSKLYFYVDDMGKAMESIVKNGGQKATDVIPEADKGFFQFFADSEGNGHAIYTYNN